MINLYGLVYTLGSLWVLYEYRKYARKIKVDPDLAYGGTLYALIGTLVISRLFYIIFYGPQYYINNPIEIFQIWNGGLSSHGGIIGAALGGWIFCKTHLKKPKKIFLEALDLISIPIITLLIAGRVINYFNGDLHSVQSDIPFLCQNFSCQHPIALYEALKNTFVLSILIYIKKNKSIKPGQLYLLFILLYSSLRIITDIPRIYETSLLGIQTGQYLNISFVIISLYLLRKYSRTNPLSDQQLQT